MGPNDGGAAAAVARRGRGAHPVALPRGVRAAHRRDVLSGWHPIFVDFAVPAEVAFDYLADPRNRPEWQSSLRRVEMLDDGQPRAGMRWVDVTAAGVRPTMEIVSFERPETWAESGWWRHRATAVLSLDFLAADVGCTVHAEFSLHLLRFPERAANGLLQRLALLAVRSDLERAARILSERAAEH